MLLSFEYGLSSTTLSREQMYFYKGKLPLLTQSEMYFNSLVVSLQSFLNKIFFSFSSLNTSFSILNKVWCDFFYSSTLYLGFIYSGMGGYRYGIFDMITNPMRASLYILFCVNCLDSLFHDMNHALNSYFQFFYFKGFYLSFFYWFKFLFTPLNLWGTDNNIYSTLNLCVANQLNLFYSYKVFSSLLLKKQSFITSLYDTVGVLCGEVFSITTYIGGGYSDYLLSRLIILSKLLLNLNSSYILSS